MSEKRGTRVHRATPRWWEEERDGRVARDGAHVAFGTSENGDELSALRVLRLRDGGGFEPLDVAATDHCRAASVALAAATEPFFFDDGSAEFTQGLIVSDLVAGSWVPWPYDDDNASDIIDLLKK